MTGGENTIHRLNRRVRLFSRNPAVFRILVCFAAYLPILAGGGECIALHFTSGGAVSFDYRHNCGKENTRQEVFPKGCGSPSVSDAHSHDSCVDIPLVSDCGIHSIPKPDLKKAPLPLSLSIPVFTAALNPGFPEPSHFPIQRCSLSPSPQFHSTVLII